MHELGITRNIVAIVGEHARGRKVTRVVVDIGRLSGVMSDAVRFAFDVVSRGTALEGARLDINDIEALACCCACHTKFATPNFYTPCACGSRDIERLAGEELCVREFEFETDSVCDATRSARVTTQ